MAPVPERDPVEWYAEHDSSTPSAPPEAEHRNGIASIQTLLGSGFSRSTTGASFAWSGGQERARAFFPRLSSLGRSESSPSMRIKSESGERDGEGTARTSSRPDSSDVPSSPSGLHSTSGSSGSVSLPDRLKRFARPEAGNRPKLDYLDGWTSREVDEQAPDPPPRRSLSSGAAAALKQQPVIADVAEAEEVLRRATDEAARKQAPPEEAAERPPQLIRAPTSPPMSPTSPPTTTTTTTTVSGDAQRCVLQCGLELVLVLASFVDIDFLHQVWRRRRVHTPHRRRGHTHTATACAHRRRARPLCASSATPPNPGCALSLSAGLVPAAYHAAPRAC